MNITGMGQHYSASSTASGKELPSSSHEAKKERVDIVNISEEGKLRYPDFQHSGTAIMQSLEGLHSTDKENVLKLGRMALGGEQTIEGWSKKGLIVSEETLLAAGKSFQKAFKANFGNANAPTKGQDFSKIALDAHNNRLKGVSFNKHEIVMNSQPVPDWFKEEYQKELSVMDNPGIKKAFEEGAAFYITEKYILATKAIKAYEQS